MITYYGYTDGSGEYYVIVDGQKCSACGDCIPACPKGILQLSKELEDELDEEEKLVVKVSPMYCKELRYVCALCKSPDSHVEAPCVSSCPAGAIARTW